MNSNIVTVPADKLAEMQRRRAEMQSKLAEMKRKIEEYQELRETAKEALRILECYIDSPNVPVCFEGDTKAASDLRDALGDD